MHVTMSQSHPNFFYVKTNLYQHITILLTKFFFREIVSKKSSLRIITSANYQNDLRKKEQCDIYEEATALTRKKKCEIFFFVKPTQHLCHFVS